MAGLSSTGIAGFIASAKFTGKKILNAAGELVSEVVSTFVSGVSGWMIQNNGDAEFKSIYARDKIVTNEYVYNRIRVTEDEEVITSNGKISSFADNSDGTYTIYLDLREGDINPFADGDLLQGYYHNPENSGVIYAVQKMTVQADPDKTDQSMIVTCEDGSLPYRYMIIVRVGNLFDTDRQSFIKISSRTNCQYFHDGINSFAALDNPNNIKCAIGKVDIGLIPAWATAAIGNVRKWFGLIADGVILRGTFVLKSSGTTMEEELDGMAERFVDVETKFEIREGQISSKITQAEVYAENAEKAAQTATNKASEATQTADGFKQTVSESTTTINNAVKDAQNAASGAAGSASDAASKLKTITEKESSINQTAGEISTKVKEVTTQATNATNSATDAANSATDAANSAKTATTKASEAKQTADGFKQTVTEETKKAVDNAVAGADDAITEKVSTAVTQSAREWKVEVMGQDEQGNPNTILAAINADASGIKIQGEKVQITGELIAEIIKASGLNINDMFVVGKDGAISASGCTFDGIYAEGFICSKFSTSFDVDDNSYPKTMNYIVNEGTQLDISLPNNEKYIGAIMTIYLNRTLTEEGMIIGGNMNYNGNKVAVLIRNKGTVLRLMATHKVNNNLWWEIINFDNRTFSLVHLISSGQTIPIIIDRSRATTPDKILNQTGSLKDVVDYWDTI